MFKVAPRYLSGVSVFLGDDITKRETDGELVIFIGPATKGPKVPLNLKSIDNAIPIYGANNPLVKAMRQFWDGYTDSPSENPLRIVGLRIGGVNAALNTSYGLRVETSDAFDGIENEYFIFVDDYSAETFNVKVWDKNKLIVFDYARNIDSKHVSVSIPAVKGSTGKVYGVDIENDPLDIPKTISEFKFLDTRVPQASGGPVLAFGLTAVPAVSENVLVVADQWAQNAGDFATASSLFPVSGTLLIKGSAGALNFQEFVEYSNFNAITKTFTLVNGVTKDFSLCALGSIMVEYLASTLVAGDSELGLTSRELYEKFRGALLDVETHTPDYIVPAGVAYNESGTYLKVNTASTGVSIPANISAPAADGGITEMLSSLTVDGAATWGENGTVKIDTGLLANLGNGPEKLFQIIRYAGIDPVASVDGYDYQLNLVSDKFALAASVLTNNASTLVVKAAAGGPSIDKLPAQGFFRILNAEADKIGYFKISNVDVEAGEITLSIHVPANWNADKNVHVGFGAFVGGLVAGDQFEVVNGAILKDVSIAIGSWSTQEQFELGIGFVKEEYNGSDYSFKWSDTKLSSDYNIAHFGYLFANFCNEAAVGYNTPLCAMNVKLPSAFDRVSIASWIGKKPEQKVVAGDTEAIEAIVRNGTGLLGEPTLAGSVKYNRCYMNDAANNKYVDPAFGLLLTDQGFVDGHEILDTFKKLVDLGKFLCVGAGLVSFNHGYGSYSDTCGIYALGYLAGKPKSEGISFSRIGVNSSVNVDVIINRKLYNELASLGYIVVTREKGLGWVINNDNSVARKDSGYRLISTTRIVKTVIEDKRAKLAGFIGKPINTYQYEAAKTKISEAFKNDLSAGLLNGFKFTLEASKTGQAIGKLYLRAIINPPLELTQVDIDTVIDRGVVGEN